MTYAQTAPTYHRLATKRYLPPARDLVRLLQPDRGGRVLDIGCGTGIATPFLREAIGESGLVVGIDQSPEMMHYAPRSANTRFVVGRIPEFPFRASAFSSAICSFVLSHLSDIQEALTRTCHIIKPGGGLGISCWGSYDSPYRDLWTELTARLSVLKPDFHAPLPSEQMLENRESAVAEMEAAGISVTTAVTSIYDAEFTASEYVEMRANLSTSQALRMTIGEAAWRHFLESAEIAYRQKFAPTFSTAFEAHLIVGTVR